MRRTFPRTPPGSGPGSGSGSDIVRVFIEQILRPVMCVGYRSVDNIILVGSVRGTQMEKTIIDLIKMILLIR